MDPEDAWPELEILAQRLDRNLDRILQGLASIDRKLDLMLIDLKGEFGEIKAFLSSGDSDG